MSDYAALIMGIMRESVVVLGADRRVVFANRAFCDAYLSGDATSALAVSLWDVDDGSWDVPELRQLLEVEPVTGLVREGSCERSHPTLGRRSLQVTARWARLPGEDADVVVLQVQDVTKALEVSTALQHSDVQLRQSQKMEAVGKLAGGVAHDFNNLLTAILGFTGLAMEDLKPSDSVYSDLVEIQKAATRASNLTAQLLSFSQQRPIDPQIIDPNQSLRDLEQILARLLSAEIELSTHLDTDVGAIRVDTTALEQIVINLAVNAGDAMPNGGQLVVETAQVTLDEGYSAAKGVPIPPGQYVTVSLSDTGVGMDEMTQQYIFEPFFTTKDVGKGTGLGLSTVYGIVKQAGGFVWVYSEVGKGTTFRIYFPQVGRVAPSASSKRRSDRPQAVQGGGETILVAEDEEQIRLLCQRALTPLGYRVLVAANGTEALKICEDESTKIDLLLSDVVMPKMGGKQLAMRLGQKRPGVKVLFMSGYTPSAIVHHGVVDQGVMLLQKPFAPDEVAEKVRTVLSADTYYAGEIAAQTPTILLVDDDAEVRDQVQALLGEGYKVTSVDTGEEALERIKLFPPDAVICACSSTEIDGPDLYSSVRALNPHLVEHFMLTASASAGDETELLRGIDRPLIRKPFEGDALRDAVWLALKGKPRTSG